MFAAYDSSNKLVYAFQAQLHQHYYCPQCHHPVQLITGLKRSYFRHYSYYPKNTAESTVHLTGKDWLKQFFSPFFEVNLEYIWDPEQRLDLPEQRLDLYVHNRTWQLAVEYQCSPISINQLTRRNQLYLKKGLHPLWIFGKRHYNQVKRIKHLQSIVSYSHYWGFYILFKLPEDNFLRLHCHYQINSQTNQIYWQTVIIKNWPQLQQLLVMPSHYVIKPVNWQFWYQRQQARPSQQFIYWQNWCYQHCYSLLQIIKKTPLITVFPIYRCFPCYLPFHIYTGQAYLATFSLVSLPVIQACATVDLNKFDNLL